MSAPTAEAAIVLAPRRLIAAGIKRGKLPFAVEYPPAPGADKAVRGKQGRAA